MPAGTSRSGLLHSSKPNTPAGAKPSWHRDSTLQNPAVSHPWEGTALGLLGDRKLRLLAYRLKDRFHKPVGVKTATFSRKACPEQGELPASKSHVKILQRPHCRHDATLPAARHHPSTPIRGNQEEPVQDRACPMTALPCLGPEVHGVKLFVRPFGHPMSFYSVCRDCTRYRL